MAAVNLLIFIHGVVEDTGPSNHAAQYDALRDALFQKQPALRARITDILRVEWGHAPFPVKDDADLCPDERLTEAENTLLNALSYDKVRATRTADDSFLNFPPDYLQRAIARPLTRPIKDTVLTLGLTDTLYYCSPDGEKAVRDNVYTQVLTQMQPYKTAASVALHVIGHSQGATIGYDFLFGMLAPDSEYPPDGVPGFVKDVQASDPAILQEYLFWRGRAQAAPQTLSLGSLSTFGSQLGLMMVRKQKLVDKLFRGERLDPTVIGVPQVGTPKWKMFYDTDDILGFPARRLFDTTGTIKEYEVDADWNPIQSHSRYWTNDQVQTEIANLIIAN